MSTEIGNLSVRLSADTSELDAGISQAGQGMRRFSASAMPAIKAMAAMGAAAAAAAGAVLAFGRAGINAIDAQAKLARQLDSTIGGLRGLQLAAEDAGVSTSVINGAVERFSARLGEAQRGTGQAADALDRLGLSARDLASMDVDERMAAIADQVQRLGLSGAQTADLLRQFGIRNREIVNLMRQGGDAIRDARQEIEDYGLAIDSVDAATIEAANDAFSRVGLVVESVRNALAVELAPVVLEIADRFNSAAREAGGWGSVVSVAVENSVRAFGSFLDVVHRLRVALGTIGLAMAELRLSFATFVDNSARGFAGLVDGMINGINAVIRGMQRIPGWGGIEEIGAFADSRVIEGVGKQWDAAFSAAGAAREEFAELVGRRLPSEAIDEFFDNIAKRREEMAESMSGEMGGGFLAGFGADGEGASGAGGATPEQQEEELERLREHMGSRLDLLRESLMEEGELETERFMDRMEELHEMRELELVGEEEHQQMMRGLAEQHHDKLNAIEQRAADERQRIQEQEAQARQAVVDGMMNNMVSLMNSGSKEMFRIGKIAAVAQALLAGREAVVNSYNAGTRIGGPPLGAAFAATAVAATAAQIASVKSTTFGGGAVTGGSTGGGGTSAIAQGPQQPEQQSPAGGTLTVEGISSSSLFSGDAVKELAEELLSYQRRGGEIIIT